MMNPITITALVGIATAAMLSGCAAIDRTRPGDMTVPEHEQAARTEATKADEAAERAKMSERGSEYEWYASERQWYAAQQHRKLADDHAAAAERRRADVASACEGVEVSIPFTSLRVERVDAIRVVDVPVNLRDPRGVYPEHLKGALVAINSPRGIPTARAARSIECVVARDSAGLDPTSENSPLAVRSAKSTVRTVYSGLVVDIRSANEDDAAEILRRANAMASVQGDVPLIEGASPEPGSSPPAEVLR